MTSGQVIISRKLQSPEYNEKYKTELCRNWMNGFCSFDAKCVFAHGKQDLRVSQPDSPETEYVLPLKTPSPKVYIKKRLPVFIDLCKRS